MRRHQQSVLDFLAIRALRVEDAEELAQETFLRAWRSLHRYSARWRFSTWLFTIARRLAASHYRTHRPRHDRGRELDEDALGERTADGRGDPARRLDADEERGRVWSLAARLLPETQRAALWLRYAEDRTIPEIARVLGARQVTVRGLLFRARERLAEHLEPPLIPPDRVARAGNRAGARPAALPRVSLTPRPAGDP